MTTVRGSLRQFGVLIVAGLGFVALGAQKADKPAATPRATAQPAPTKQVIFRPGRPNSAGPAAVRVGDLVFLSGVAGDWGNPDRSIEGQTRDALNHLKGAMEAAGTAPQYAVQCTVFLADRADLPGMNREWHRFFTGDAAPLGLGNNEARRRQLPARTIGAYPSGRTHPSDPGDKKIELDCIAVVPH